MLFDVKSLLPLVSTISKSELAAVNFGGSFKTIKKVKGPSMQQLDKSLLVGGFNPSEKYARQNGNLPQFSG